MSDLPPLPELPEVKIRTILYATDLSPSAKLALAYALNVANTYCAKLVILHAIDETPEIVDTQVVGYIGAGEWEKIKSGYDEDITGLLMRKTRSQEVMQRILKRMRRAQDVGNGDGMYQMNQACPIDLKDEVVVRRGQSVTTILDVAREKQCDLIIMGSHGHSRLVDAMMGVTASRVIRRSEIPVLVIRLPKE